MPTFKLDKLVRDKFPEIYEALGQEAVVEKLSKIDLSKALLDKIIEEAAEIKPESSREELLEEIADIQQIIDDLKSENNLTDEEIANIQESKKAEKGGFKEGVFIKTLTVPENDKWVEYYRKEPSKYPEI